MNETPQSPVRDNPAQSRFEMQVGDSVAVVLYRRGEDGVLSLVHSEVPWRMQGRGIGSQLMEGLLKLVRERGQKIRPRCSFVADYMARHPDDHDLLA